MYVNYFGRYILLVESAKNKKVLSSNLLLSFFIGHTTDMAAVSANSNNCCCQGGVGLDIRTHRVILKKLKIIPTASSKLRVKKMPYPIKG